MVPVCLPVLMVEGSPVRAGAPAACTCLGACLGAGPGAARLLWLAPLVEAAACEALRAACGSSCLLAARPCKRCLILPSHHSRVVFNKPSWKLQRGRPDGKHEQSMTPRMVHLPYLLGIQQCCMHACEGSTDLDNNLRGLG